MFKNKVYESLFDDIETIYWFVGIVFVATFFLDFTPIKEYGEFKSIILIGALPFSTYCITRVVKWVFEYMKVYFDCKQEVIFFSVFVFVAMTLSFIICNKTEIFFGYQTDIVYGMDCELYFRRNWDMVADGVFVRPSPMLGNILFTIIARFFSRILFFVKNAYPALCMTNQLVQVYIMGLILKKEMKLNQREGWLFRGILLCSSSILIFMFSVERYIPTVFLLVVCVGAINRNARGKNAMIAFSGMPLFINWGMIAIDSIEEGWKKYFSNMFKTIGYIILFFCVSGRIFILKPSAIIESISWYGSFSGSVAKITFGGQVKQFFQTVVYMFFHPKLFTQGGMLRLPENSIWPLGVVIFVIIISICYTYRSDRIIKLCSWTIFMSVIIHMVVGLGAVLNEIFLYSVLYSWAYVVVAYVGIKDIIIKKISSKSSCLAKIVVLLSVTLFIVVNLCWLIEILIYGINTYPAL